MAGAVKFATDDEIRAALSLPFGLAYQACALGTSLSRARSIRDKFKTEIVTARVEVHRQTVQQIAFHLEILEHIETLKNWHKAKYGATT